MIITGDEFKKSYIENNTHTKLFEQDVLLAYREHKPCAEMEVSLDDLYIYQDIADYYGYKAVLKEGLSEKVLNAGRTIIYIVPKGKFQK